MGEGRKRRRWKQDCRGFTLVEIIVVLVILAILAAFTIPAMLGFVEDARGKAYITEAREIYTAMQSALTEVGAQQTNEVGGNEYFYGLYKENNVYKITFKPSTKDVSSTETEQKIGQKALELIGNDI